MRLKVADLIPGANYSVQARAVKDGQVSEWSEKFDFSTAKDETQPKAPVDVTWDSVGDAFVATWSPVTENIANKAINVASYEIELVSSDSIRKVVSIPAQTGETLNYTLSLGANRALFGSPKPDITIRVRAVNNKKIKGVWSSPDNAVNPAPAAPTNFTASVLLEGISLSWDEVPESDIKRYEVYYGTTSGFTPSSANMIFSGVATKFMYKSTSDANHYFKLCAVDQFGSKSTFVAATAAPSIPATPTGVTWASVGNSFHGEWNKVTLNIAGGESEVSRYEIEMTGQPGSVLAYASVPQATESPKVSFDLPFEENVAKFIAPKATIAIRVRAVDLRGLVSDWSSSVSAGNNPPAAPTGLSSNIVGEAIELKWNAVADTDLSGYRVYLSTNGGSTYNKVYEGQALNYTFTSAMYGTDHYFQVKAFDQFGLESAASNTVGPVRPTSSFAVDTTPPGVPTGLSATITTTADAVSTSALVSWNAVADSDLDGYKLRYRKAGDTNWSSLSVGKDVTTTVINALTPYVNYEFQIASFDYSANNSAYSATATGTGAANAAPSTPAAPTVASNTMQIQVVPTGTKAAGGAMEADVSYYRVYASTTSGFTPSSANMLGEIQAGPAMAGTFPIPATGGATSTQTWYVKIIAVDTTDQASPESAQVAATPGLIGTTNIVDAAITNAKIQNVRADQIIAGTGFINNLTVKSTLTIGDATTTGYIESYDWQSSGGTSGYRISKGSIEIKNGTIAASAITLTSQFANDVGATMTTIDGGVIKTGSIQSQSTTVVAGNTIPIWSIPLNGSATFANLTVRGLSIVGVSGDGSNSGIQSANYNGSVGWKIDSAGNAYFATGTFKGDITGASGTFSGNITGSAATVTGTITGNTYQTSTASTYVVRINTTGLKMYGASSTVPIVEINTDGTAKFGGQLTAASGTFEGDVVGGSLRTSNTNAYCLIDDISGYGGNIDFYYGGIRTARIDTFGSNTSLRLNFDTENVFIGSGGSTADYRGRVDAGLIRTKRFDNPWDTTPIIFDHTVRFDWQTTFSGYSLNDCTGMNNNSGSIRLDFSGGSAQFIGGTNIRAKFKTTTGSGTSLVLKDNNIIAAVEGYDAASNTSGNTVLFHANELHAWGGGIFDETYAGGGSTGATINNNGRIVRTSTMKMKEAVEEMTLTQAKVVLGLKSYTFEYKETEGIKDPRRYPGFIAEQAAEAGAELWVGRQHKPIFDKDGNVTGFTRDDQGEITSFRTESISVAHNLLIKELYEKVDEANSRADAAEARVNSLEDRLAALETAMTA